MSNSKKYQNALTQTEQTIRSEAEFSDSPLEKEIKSDDLLPRPKRKRRRAKSERGLLTGRKQSRNQLSASTLFSGTLSCGYCGQEIKLIRSTKKYKQMGCLNGPRHACDCKLTSSKSTTIIEGCLLSFLWDHVLTESTIKDLIERANAYLKREAEKPQIDVAPLKSEVRKREKKFKKLMQRIESEDDETLLDAYDERIKQLQSELQPLRQQVQEAERQNRKKDIKPLDAEHAGVYLTAIRDLFNQEIPAAAEAIRNLTGPITIHQEPIPGKKRGARWVATFEPDLIRLLSRLAKKDGLPERILLESVDRDKKTELTVPLEKIPKYKSLAPEFLRLHENGASVQSLASAHGMSWDYANDILEYAKTGKRPTWKSGTRTGNGGPQAKYIEHAPEVARLRDEENMEFTQIAKRLKVSRPTARRAYDHAHQDEIRSAVEEGRKPDRGQGMRLGANTHGRIREMLRAGQKSTTIVAEADCGVRTVYRIRRELRDAGEAV